MNTNEIANGMLACLVAVTGCCPFIDPIWAIVIGSMLLRILSNSNYTVCAYYFCKVLTIFWYHVGCWLEYVMKLHDGARVVPVHAVWLVITPIMMLHIMFFTVVCGV